MAYNNTIIYAGPTSSGIDLYTLDVKGLIVRPPVRRGDIDQLLLEQPAPGRIVIIDGTYHSFPSVGHVEIRCAINAGWDVWGLCSMGAIRAYEMRDMGMRGFGQAYQCFFQHDDFQDDEVSLLHGDEPPYVPLSEPLLHLRGALSQLVTEGRVANSAAAQIVSELKAMWFGYRTLPRVRTMLRAADGGVDITAGELESLVFANRIKRQDLLNFMASKPWLSRSV
jgi:hypothetical protein